MTTPRDNLLRTLRRQGFEWTPLDCNCFCPSQEETFQRRFGHADYFSWFKVPFRSVSLELRKTYERPQGLYLWETLPNDTDFDVWGIGRSHQPNCYHMTHMHHPLAGDATLDDVRRYPLPVISEAAPMKLQAGIDALHHHGLAARGQMARTLWEVSWHIRSMEDLMMDMMMEDERAPALLDRITENAIRQIRAYVKAGADIIELGDDIGMQKTIMMSLDLWRKWLKPRLTRIIAAGREIKPDILIFYHSCGYVLPFINELIEVGVDILEPVQPECMNFDDVHRLGGGRLSFWGTIGTQTTLPFGAPADVKAAVASRLRTCGKAGGIVIGPTHMVEPEVPWDNLVAMAEAAAEFKN